MFSIKEKWQMFPLVIASNRNHSLYELLKVQAPPNTIWPDGFET